MPSSYTYGRRPVKLLWTSEETPRYSEALQWERQIKGWNRAKKQALIHGDFDAIHEIVKVERKRREEVKKNAPPSITFVATSVPHSAQDEKDL